MYIEIELFNITKIHNNKVHSTTKRKPREIWDIDDTEAIAEINQEITNTLLKKQNFDLLDPINFMSLTIINFILIMIEFLKKR